MSLAFEELFAVRDALNGIPIPGRTDAWIVSEAARAIGLSCDDPGLATFRDVYLRHLAIAIEQPGPRKSMMPGVRELLDALSARDDVHLALLTGNYEAAARIKLEYFDLWRYFECGAFGDAAMNRNLLVPRAVERVAACGGLSFAAEDIVVVGDTPLDVAAAQAFGARSLGVATGSYGVEELRASGADVVFDDLSDTDRVVSAIRIRTPQSEIRN